MFFLKLKFKSGDNVDLLLPIVNQSQDMEYIDMLIYETLRRYPISGVIQRGCNEDYELPGHPGVIVKKDFEVYVNVAGIHMDPRYYPDPEAIIPERFNKEEKAKRHP
jgi:cytochrome P450